jgi:hypothetical protein
MGRMAAARVRVRVRVATGMTQQAAAARAAAAMAMATMRGLPCLAGWHCASARVKLAPAPRRRTPPLTIMRQDLLDMPGLRATLRAQSAAA